MIFLKTNMLLFYMFLLRIFRIEIDIIILLLDTIVCKSNYNVYLIFYLMSYLISYLLSLLNILFAFLLKTFKRLFDD